MAIDVDASRQVTTTADTDECPSTEADSITMPADNARANTGPAPTGRPPGFVVGFIAMITAIVAVTALAGWFGFQLQQAHNQKILRAQLLETGRQAAVNLTTIDSATIDADIKRILDSATNPFATEFGENATRFADVVRQARSKSVGTVTAAGIETQEGENANVLVSVSVTTTTARVLEDRPRLWRMRITVHLENEGVRISQVGFVP